VQNLENTWVTVTRVCPPQLLDVVPLPNGKVMLVLEYCVTDLNRMLTHGLPEGECRKLPPTVVKSVLSSLLRALEHCHSNGIIHLVTGVCCAWPALGTVEKFRVSQDLKPPNVLFTSDGALKLCDFGMSVQWSGEPMALHSNVVTPWYRAPELLMNTRNHSPKVDMWAAACIFAELMVGAPLFDACNDLGIMKQICDKIGAPSVAVWPVS
jgi:serine/threonine protein kinase